MDSLAVIVLVVAVAASLAAAGLIFVTLRRDKRRMQREIAAASAAHAYLALFEIHAQVVAVTLADNSIALMVEAPPQKKLRFSYIIEQPIKQFVLKQTQVEVTRMFWRFPLPPKDSKTAEVHYGESAPPVATTPIGTAEEDDEYFQHPAYQIEEISWEKLVSVSHPKSSPKASKK